MMVGDWISVGAGAVALASPFITYGMLRQKVNDLSGQLSNAASKESVHAIDARLGNLATTERVANIEGRVGELESDMREARVALGTIPVISEKLTGFEKLMSVRMEGVDYSLRNVKQAIEALGRPRSRSADD
jgi:hypothetical protein